MKLQTPQALKLSSRTWTRWFIATAIGCLAQLPAWADTALDPAMVTSLRLEDFKTIRLIDEDGKPLSVEEFKARIAARTSFALAKDAESSTATLTLKKGPLVPMNTIGLAQGSRMPALQLTDTQGRVRTWDEFGDKPVLLNFFFAECAPCIQEVPTLNAFIKSNPDVAVLAVTYETSAVTQKFIARHGLMWPAVADGRDFITSLGVKSYPTLLLVGPNRTLLAIKTGGITVPENKSGYIFSLESWVRQNLK
jgi:peroxiredoxin